MSTLIELQSAVEYPVAIWVSAPGASYPGCKNESPFTLYISAEGTCPQTISLYAENSRSIPYQQPQNKWSHLNAQWRFTDVDDNVITEITPTEFTIVENVSGESIGYHTSAQFYYIDDRYSTLGSPISIWAVADFGDHSVYLDSNDRPGHSNSSVEYGISHEVSATAPTELQVTRNGVDGLNAYYWNNTEIPFVITVNSAVSALSCTPIAFDVPISNAYGVSAGVMTRSMSLLPDANLTWTPTSSVYLSATDQSNFNINGFVRGSVLSTELLSSTTITVTSNVFYEIYNSSLSAMVVSSVSLVGESDAFSILDPIDYKVRKFDESWDASAYVKSQARSPHINHNEILWDGYMDAVWGNSNSDYNKAFGRNVYERIANFTNNRADIDECNIDQVYDLAAQTDVPIDDYGLEFPAELGRLMDIVSINQQRLWGTRCTYNEFIEHEYKTVLSGTELITVDAYCPESGRVQPGNRGAVFSPEPYIVSAYSPFIQLTYKRRFYRWTSLHNRVR